jgi:hypothetical protein
MLLCRLVLTDNQRGETRLCFKRAPVRIKGGVLEPGKAKEEIAMRTTPILELMFYFDKGIREHIIRAGWQEIPGNISIMRVPISLARCILATESWLWVRVVQIRYSGIY